MYEAEIQILKTEHKEEIDKLKEEHLKILNGALERARRKSLRDSDSLSKGELAMLKERDNLKKQVSSFRNLFRKVLKYFARCEDDLNNTLVEELLKHGFDENMFIVEEEFNVTNSSQASSSKTSDTSVNVTRVHLTPNFTDLLNLTENNYQQDCDSEDISIDQLTTIVNREEPTETTTSSLEQKVSLMTRQLIDEVESKKKLKEELDEALKYVESLGKEKDELEKQLEQVVAKVKILESDLVQAKNKIAELIENGHKEIVSEGYGEEGSNMRESGSANVDRECSADEVIQQGTQTDSPDVVIPPIEGPITRSRNKKKTVVKPAPHIPSQAKARRGAACCQETAKCSADEVIRQGTQTVSPDVVIPPIEGPITRSRNKKKQL